MAKRRMIDSDFWEEPKVAKMSDSHRLFILGCINEADDKGRLIAETQHLKAVIWKYHSRSLKWVQNIRDDVCNSLRGFRLYQVDGVKYIQLINWERYQILRKDRMKESRYPSPPQGDNQMTTNRQPTNNQMSAQDKLSKDKINKSYCPTSEEVRLAKLLFSLIRERKPNYQVKIKSEKQKEALYQKWAEHIDKLVRIDERGPAQIEAVIRWCQKDDFWKDNILSTEKLREKIDKLELKMAKPEAEKEKYY